MGSDASCGKTSVEFDELLRASQKSVRLYQMCIRIWLMSNIRMISCLIIDGFDVGPSKQVKDRR